MTEFVGTLARVAGIFSLAWLIGGAAFMLLLPATADPLLAAWRARRDASFAWAALVCFLATLAILSTQAALTVETPIGPTFAEGATLKEFAFGTHYGRVILFKLSILLVLFASAVLLARAPSRRPQRAAAGLILILGALVAASGALAGHAGGDERAAWLMPLNAVHALGVCVWIGGLPAWIGLVATVSQSPNPRRCAWAAAVLRRFSRLATSSMAAIIFSGVPLAAAFVRTQGDLFGTLYGLLICAKVLMLIGVLLIANHLRRRFLPTMEDASADESPYKTAARWVALELGLATGILGLAGVLLQTTPAAHTQPYWWAPFRLSIDATWQVWPTPLMVYGGCLLLAVSALWIFFRRGRLTPLGLAAPVALGVLGAGVALSSLTVPAFPDTFRRSPEPYLTVSIDEGRRTFERHCTGCHGPGGLGDGPAAKGLPKPPANLTEPHTALHTAGDMFWWVTHGIPTSGMPAFAEVTSEEERWDSINFLRAFSQGFQARILTPAVVAGRPWLGAPDFYLDDPAGRAHELKDFRERSNVLLVFPDSSRDSSMARLRELGGQVARMRGDRLEVIVVSDQDFGGDAGPATRVREGAEAIRDSYELLSRTLANRGDGRSIGMNRSHMEFLIDRFGYIRARWIPDEEPGEWSGSDLLQQQVAILNAEPRLLPPPDDHVH
jgi:putative copper resistance protein D